MIVFVCEHATFSQLVSVFFHVWPYIVPPQQRCSCLLPANRKKFEKKRKAHYNEFQAIKLARQLMEQEEDDEEDEDQTTAVGDKTTDAS